MLEGGLAGCFGGVGVSMGIAQAPSFLALFSLFRTSDCHGRVMFTNSRRNTGIRMSIEAARTSMLRSNAILILRTVRPSVCPNISPFLKYTQCKGNKKSRKRLVRRRKQALAECRPVKRQTIPVENPLRFPANE